MIKLWIKHTLANLAINVMFERLSDNFSGSNKKEKFHENQLIYMIRVQLCENTYREYYGNQILYYNQHDPFMAILTESIQTYNDKGVLIGRTDIKNGKMEAHIPLDDIQHWDG